MAKHPSFLCSTIGRKYIVAFTGLGLSLFVLTHMLGNVLIFAGPQAYNEYSHALVSNPLIYIAEAGLIAIFVAHLGLALGLTVKNFLARPQKYAVRGSGEKMTSPVASAMWAQGIIIFVFVVLHLITFKFGTVYSVNYGKGEIRDLYRLAIEVFQSAGYLTWYLICLLVLGLHLSHGIKSMIQTFGFNHPKYECLIAKVSYGYAALVSIGFAAPIVFVKFFLGPQ